MCGYLCSEPSDYTDPHTVYTPVETISDPPLDAQGRHSLRETQEKRQKCRGEEERGMWREHQEKKDERKRELVTDWQTHIETHTHRWEDK